MPELSTESWVVAGIVATIWALKELSAILLKWQQASQAKVARSRDTGGLERPSTPGANGQAGGNAADASGAFSAMTEQLASKREVDALKTDLQTDIADIKTDIGGMRSDIAASLQGLTDKFEAHQKDENDKLTALTGAVGNLQGQVEQLSKAG